jgi:hypothetical protein
MIPLALLLGCAGGCASHGTAADPIGPAKDQCWKYVFEREEFKAAANFDCRISSALEGCVELASCTVEDGRATFAICCKKDADGDCKNCRTVVELTVRRADVSGATEFPKNVLVKCVKPPPQED